MCTLDKRLLQEYLDFNIEPPEEIILEEHLSACPECQAYLNGLKVMDWDLRRHLGKDIKVPEEVSLLRNIVLETYCCLEDQKEEMPSLTARDLLNIQVSTFNNSLKFINLLPGFRKNEKASKHKKSKKSGSLLRRIIGL